MEPANTVLAYVISLSVLALLGIAGTAVAWGRSRLKQEIDSHVSNAAVNAALTWANEVVFALVAEAQQTAVAQLKKDLASGAVGPDEYKKTLTTVRDNVLLTAVGLASSKLQSALAITPEQTQALLGAKIEQGVLAMKSQSVVGQRVYDPLAPSPRG